MRNTRPPLGGAGTTAAASLARIAPTAFAHAATATATADRHAADHSVTVIATRDGRPMAVAVVSRAERATKASLPPTAPQGADTKDGGAAATPGTGTGPRRLLGTLYGPSAGPPAPARALAPA